MFYSFTLRTVKFVEVMYTSQKSKIKYYNSFNVFFDLTRKQENFVLKVAAN